MYSLTKFAKYIRRHQNQKCVFFFKRRSQPEWKSVSPASMLQRGTLAPCVGAVVSLQGADVPPAESDL